MERSIDETKEMHARVEMEQLVTNMLHVFDLHMEVDAEVQTCGIPAEPTWHIYGIENLRRVAKELNEPIVIEKFTCCGDTWEYKCWFRHRGLYIFCLALERELGYEHEAHRTN